MTERNGRPRRSLSPATWPGKLVRLPLRLIPRTATMPILRGRGRGTRWITGSSTHGAWWGSYERDMRRLIEASVTPGSVVFDIGAHVGLYTLLASRLVGPGGTVVAFEPLPRNLRYLREHLRINRIGNVRVIDAAVSDRAGTSLFDQGHDSFSGHMSPDGSLRVRTVGIDALIARGDVPIPDYIKIDVEGAERLVIDGARSTLATARPTLFLSVHGPDLRRQCGEVLRALGYALQAVGARRLETADQLLAAPRG